MSNDNELALAICEALGLDPKRMVKLVLTCEAHQLPTIDVTEVVVSDEEIDGDRLIEVLSNYELVRRDDVE